MAEPVRTARVCGIDGYIALARMAGMALSCWLTWAHGSHRARCAWIPAVLRGRIPLTVRLASWSVVGCSSRLVMMGCHPVLVRAGHVRPAAGSVCRGLAPPGAGAPAVAAAGHGRVPPGS